MQNNEKVIRREINKYTLKCLKGAIYIKIIKFLSLQKIYLKRQ